MLSLLKSHQALLSPLPRKPALTAHPQKPVSLAPFLDLTLAQGLAEDGGGGGRGGVWIGQPKSSRAERR